MSVSCAARLSSCRLSSTHILLSCTFPSPCPSSSRRTQGRVPCLSFSHPWSLYHPRRMLELSFHHARPCLVCRPSQVGSWLSLANHMPHLRLGLVSVSFQYNSLTSLVCSAISWISDQLRLCISSLLYSLLSDLITALASSTGRSPRSGS